MKRVLCAFCLLLLAMLNTGCGKIQCFGGDIPKIDYLMELGDEEYFINVPLITKTIIKDTSNVKLEGFETDSKSNIEITLKDVSFSFDYKNYYVYSVRLLAKDSSLETPARIKLKTLHLSVNGKKGDLSFDDVYLTNMAYFEQKYGVDTSSRDLLISSGITTLFNYWPSDFEQFGRKFQITYEAEKDLVLDEFFLMGDFLTIDSFSIDGKEHNPSELGYALQTDKEAKISCSFKRNPGVEEKNILCDTVVIKYTVDDRKCALTLNGGVQIWKNFGERNEKYTIGAIKTYISENLANK